MKRIIYTQRVDIVKAYGERRDAADQRIPEFLSACGFLPIPSPNHPELAKDIIDGCQFDGVFFTGGNSLVKYGGDAPERDETERCLLEIAMAKGCPVFGICRGLQFNADYFGTTLSSCEGHVRTRHDVTGRITRQQANSFHTMGIKEVPLPLVELGKSEDGFVEAVKHETLPVAAVMWHPERETPFHTEDIEMIRDFFMRGTIG